MGKKKSAGIKSSDSRILWAPWRSDYVTHASKPGKCIFCGNKPHIICRGKYSFVMLNCYPYNAGHLMVAPYRHVADPAKLLPEESREMFSLIKKSINVLKKVLHPQGFNLGMNLGSISGAGYAGHLHVHIVPRWAGDTNFMPVISKTKVISESLEKMQKQLSRLFNG